MYTCELLLFCYDHTSLIILIQQQKFTRVYIYIYKQAEKRPSEVETCLNKPHDDTVLGANNRICCIVNKASLVHNFSQYVYFFSVHVSCDCVPIVRRNNCICATLGTSCSVIVNVIYLCSINPNQDTILWIQTLSPTY